MRKPTKVRSPFEEMKREWLCGWWAGLVVGFINGVAVCVLVANHLGKI